ncbi:hypothetical protein [Microbacterium sp. K24]|uniref:hypothetical protein n=1 Tax=Microbacterium sp. K24 TaxID=2305446 RepID=UPI00109D4226|nr:hypothetical protein [Microbacterium sp. K24]
MNLPRPASVPIIALALVCAALVGCSPTPAPKPTPTPAFASEEEAFAAAEETYREYNEASNADLAGNSTKDPQDYLIGSALEGFLDGREYLRTNGLALQGETHVINFQGESATISLGSTEVSMLVCLDISATTLIDVSGRDVTPATRPGTVGQRVTLIADTSAFRISQESEAEAGACLLG